MQKLYFLVFVTQFMIASQKYTEHSLSEYWNGMSKSIVDSTSSNSITQELIDKGRLKLLQQTIKNLVRLNDANPDRILNDIDHLFFKFIPKKCKYFPFIIQQSFSDTSAFNWCLHATKGDMELFNYITFYIDQKNRLQLPPFPQNDRWRRLWLVIYDSFEHLLNRKFIEVTSMTEIGEDQKVLRCKGKNYKEDKANGSFLSKEQVENYWQESLAPRVYTNVDFISKRSINKDRSCIKTSLLCIKQSKFIPNRSAFRKIFKELIAPSVCVNIIQELQKNWDTLYLNLDTHIRDSLDRYENKQSTFTTDSAQSSMEFFKNYHKWYALKKEARLKDTRLMGNFICKLFADTHYKYDNTIDKIVQIKEIQKKGTCILC